MLLTRLAALARQERVQLVLLSGDLLDSDHSYFETGEELCRCLAGMGAPVFIAPGNHDYYSSGSPYAAMEWPDNVHIFRSRRPEAVRLEEEGVTVYGAAFTAPHAGPELEGFRARSGERAVMVLHGEWTEGESLYCPIRRAFAEGSGLSYLALGHVHGSFVQKVGRTTVANPGCAMGRGFDEVGEKGALLAELSDDGCLVRPVPLGARPYRIRTLDVTGRDPIQAADAVLPADTRDEICRLILTGECLVPDLSALRRALEGRFFDLELCDRTRPPLELWSGLQEDSLKGAFLRRMRACFDEASDEDKPTAALAAHLVLELMDGREVAEE